MSTAPTLARSYEALRPRVLERVLELRATLDPSLGRCLFLGTATLSMLGYEHNRSEPVLRLWNDARHVGD